MALMNATEGRPLNSHKAERYGRQAGRSPGLPAVPASGNSLEFRCGADRSNHLVVGEEI